MAATVTKLSTTKTTNIATTKNVAAKDKKPNKRSRIDAMRQTLATASIASVALTLTGLSLTHLTSGIQQVTGGQTVESAAMAVGIDLSFVALEVSQVLRLPEVTAKIVKKFAQPAIIGTMLASAALNAFGFAAHAEGLMIYPEIMLGCAIPALIYALTRVSVALAK